MLEMLDEHVATQWKDAQRPACHCWLMSDPGPIMSNYEMRWLFWLTVSDILTPDTLLIVDTSQSWSPLSIAQTFSSAGADNPTKQIY